MGKLDPQMQVWTDIYNERDEDRVAAIATHYDLPLVSMRAALLGAVKEDREAAHARSETGRRRRRAPLPGHEAAPRPVPGAQSAFPHAITNA